MGKVVYQETSKPVKQIQTVNSKRYNDLIINKNKNGKAIRIANKFGSAHVFVTIDTLDEFIADLQLIKSSGLSLSVHEVSYVPETNVGLRRAA